MSETAAKKTFKVISSVSIRRDPGLDSPRVGTGLNVGAVIVADANSRKEVDGFVWWKHNQGWSAEKKSDGSSVYLELISEETVTLDVTKPGVESTAEPLYFKVVQRLSIRRTPSLNGDRVGDGLQVGSIIQAEPDSQQTVEGYLWWKHSAGWSAEKTSDGRVVYMEKTEKPAVVTVESKPATTTSASQPTVSSGEKRSFKVMQSVSIRKTPSLSGERLTDMLAVGVLVDCDAGSQTEVDGYVWWKHSLGWSAEKKSDGSILYLGDPNAQPPVNDDGTVNTDGLPMRDSLFVRLPVGLTDTAWTQYFGNTRFAYENGAAWGYPSFAQGLHSGIDLANRSATLPIYAGVNGTFLRNNRFGVGIQAGEYVIIYQHLVNTNSFVKGGQVTPDTVVGTLDPSLGSNMHLHLEVRYDREKWIVNPLLLVADEIRQGIMAKFPTFSKHFYSDERWNKWVTPLDQPVISRGGPVIGPTA
jgi:hypothetical protein